MEKFVPTPQEKIKYERLTNLAKKSKNDIARSFIKLAMTLKEIKDTKVFELKFSNFKDYALTELDIDWRTAYDYIKIAAFIAENRTFLTENKAMLLGHKKLKLLTQTLSDLELGFRRAIILKIDEKESYTELKEKIKDTLKKLKLRR